MCVNVDADDERNHNSRRRNAGNAKDDDHVSALSKHLPKASKIVLRFTA